jgi:predicted alpha-1,6-mannanase (GH76 family)
MRLRDIDYVLTKLHWMREHHVWPNGLRYLWTDAFGLVLLISLYSELHQQAYLDDAEKLVRDVDRVLGRSRGIRIGEAADRDGQYFHYLAVWLYALTCLSEHISQYRARAIALARDVHRAFVLPGRGVIWKMKEDLSGPYPGFGYGALDAFNGYVAYRLLGEQALEPEIMEMRELIERDYERTPD